MRGLLAVVLATTATLTNAADNVVDERAILRELYQATGGDNWDDNYGWAENRQDICQWKGVICNPDDLETSDRRHLQVGGVVVGLTLTKNSMFGRTPASLWQLPNLQEINFSFNPHLEVDFALLQQTSTTTGNSLLRSVRLHDTGTTSIVGLRSASETLLVLQLSSSKLNTQLPADLYELTKLSTLSLGQCGLQGSIPDDIHRLSMLHELNFFDNALTGELPAGMARMVHMTHLTLSFNQFHGTLPEYLNDMLLLEQFWAIDNDFTGQVPSFPKAPGMIHLNVKGNSLGGEIPNDFLWATLDGPRADTIVVDLSHNEFSGMVPGSLDYLEDLDMTWYLGDNAFTSVAGTICDNVNWNNGAISEFDCQGFLCPPGSFNKHGFRTKDADCQSCQSNDEYLGATNCYDKDDRSVLIELYVATGGENWNSQVNWLESDNVCDWQGISCWDLVEDSKLGRVRKVELPNNGLQGIVPTTIYSMKHLTTLDFSRNAIVLPFTSIGESAHMYSINIAGTDTTDFDGMEHAQDFFRELWADQIQISGTLPKELYGATTLTILSLQECDLSGTISEELSSLARLEELYLTGNNFKGQIPDVFGDLPALQILALAKNQLTGTLPASFDTAASLLAVSLQDQVTKGGGIGGEIKSYPTSLTLRTLLLANNKLEGAIPDDLLASVEFNLPVTVDFSNNLIEGQVPEELSRFDRMNLYLEGNFISLVADRLCRQEKWMNGNVGAYGCDAILCPAGTMGGRRMYTDGGCQVCPAGSKIQQGTHGQVFLGQQTCGDREEDLTERDILALVYQQCGGVGWHATENWMTEVTICEWYGIDCDENGSVASVVLGSNQLVGSFPTDVFMLPNLAQLKLHSNTIYFSFDGVENAKSLEILSLDDTGLDSLRGSGFARSLKELTIGFNKFSGPVPEEVSRLIHLETLVISNNAFDGFIPYWIRGLPSLTTFAAANNRLSGPLYEFGVFGDLIYLDLSNNQLTGGIPSGFLSDVDDQVKVVANLAGNQLTGTIPSVLGRLSLLSLQLKNNKITGINSDLCDAAKGWNDNDVQEFGCDGILCPAGTWSGSGRQTALEAPCKPCKDAKFMGTARCSGAVALGTFGAYLLAATTASCLLWL
jgi:Leucine-rich repeat (LRR) protein